MRPPPDKVCVYAGEVMHRRLLDTLAAQNITFSDLDTVQSSLEDIFVSLVEDGR